MIRLLIVIECVLLTIIAFDRLFVASPPAPPVSAMLADARTVVTPVRLDGIVNPAAAAAVRAGIDAVERSPGVGFSLVAAADGTPSARIQLPPPSAPPSANDDPAARPLGEADRAALRRDLLGPERPPVPAGDGAPPATGEPSPQTNAPPETPSAPQASPPSLLPAALEDSPAILASPSQPEEMRPAAREPGQMRPAAREAVQPPPGPLPGAPPARPAERPRAVEPAIAGRPQARPTGAGLRAGEFGSPPARPAEAAAAGQGSGPSPTEPSPEVTTAQRLLARLGYAAGLPDGVAGSRTIAAVRSYQNDTGLRPDGQITGDLIRQLSQDAHNRSAARRSTAAVSAPPSTESSGLIDRLFGGVQRLFRNRFDGVARPAELLAYCRTQPDNWVFDAGHDAFVYCGEVARRGYDGRGRSATRLADAPAIPPRRRDLPSGTGAADRRRGCELREKRSRALRERGAGCGDRGGPRPPHRTAPR